VTDDHVEPSGESGTSSSLLRRTIHGDTDAWERLVSLYGPLVYGWCRRWGLQPSEAENVSQEVFLRLFRRLDRFHRDKKGDTFRGWLYVTTRNCFVDLVRKRRVEGVAAGGTSAKERMEQVVCEDDESAEASLAEDRAQLYRRATELMRREFNERDWAAFHAVVLENRPAAEVATRLNVTVNVVYLAKSRIMRRLREEFAELIEF
jgi:RNA polymerase sigma-70 factor, ECF subfamily